MTSLLKLRVLTTLLTSRVSCSSPWARQNFPARLKIERILSQRKIPWTFLLAWFISTLILQFVVFFLFFFFFFLGGGGGGGCTTVVNRGSYTSGHFIWNLWNSPKARFINFSLNDHEFQVLFIIWPFKMVFRRLENEHYFNRKTHCRHGRCQWRHMNAPNCYYIVIIQCLWHDVIHWIPATSYDKIHLQTGYTYTSNDSNKHNFCT